jgi:hypothetical protein
VSPSYRSRHCDDIVVLEVNREIEERGLKLRQFLVEDGQAITTVIEL